jgi:hypothetical protein
MANPMRRRLLAVVTALAATLSGSGLLSAQSTPPGGAYANDHASADAIISALYAVISGPAGEKRDWDRFRSLFVPDARLIVARTRPDSAGRILPRVMSVDGYVAGAGGLEKNGFFEREIAQTSETFGSVTHRFSTYESRHTAADPAPFARGINSIQLFNNGQRWYVVTIYWDSERPGLQIPDKYLPR